MTPTTLLFAIAVGVGATFGMDVWHRLLRRMGVPAFDYCLLGRWVGHMPQGRFRHSSIASAAKRPFECPLGWMAHYTIGASLGVAFVALTSPAWLARPTLLPALGFGAVTVALPLLVLQPGLGLGIAGSKTSHPARVRVKSLATHVIFGGGLYVSAHILGWLLRAIG
jgi:hypothetical protein